MTEPIDRVAEIHCYMRDPDGYLIEVGQATGLLEGKVARKQPEVCRLRAEVRHATIARHRDAQGEECASRLVLHPRRDQTPVVQRLISWARSHGKQVIADARDAARLPEDVELVSDGQLVDQAEA